MLNSEMINLIYRCGFQSLQNLTISITYVTARRDIRAENKRPFVTQSEVTCTPSPHLDSQPQNYHVNHYHHRRRVATLRSQGFMTSLQNGSCAPESVTHACIPFHSENTKQYTNMHRLVCLHMCGSCSSWP